jgi:hypothetical protein
MKQASQKPRAGASGNARRPWSAHPSIWRIFLFRLTALALSRPNPRTISPHFRATFPCCNTFPTVAQFSPPFSSSGLPLSLPKSVQRCKRTGWEAGERDGGEGAVEKVWREGLMRENGAKWGAGGTRIGRPSRRHRAAKMEAILGSLLSLSFRGTGVGCLRLSIRRPCC